MKSAHHKIAMADNDDTQRTLDGEWTGDLGLSPSSALICRVLLGESLIQNLICELMTRWLLQSLLSVGVYKADAEFRLL